MNFRQKLIYTTYGALIAFVGMWFTSAIAPPVTAERETDIVCTSLKVVNEVGNTVVSLDARDTDTGGGGIRVNDKTGETGIILFDAGEEIGGIIGIAHAGSSDETDGGLFGVLIYNDEKGGRIDVTNKAGNEHVILKHIEHGGIVGIEAVEEDPDKGGVHMLKDKEGGRIEVYDKTGKSRVKRRTIKTETRITRSIDGL